MFVIVTTCKNSQFQCSIDGEGETSKSNAFIWIWS